MAIQIREAVRNSLNDFVEFFELYEVKHLYRAKLMYNCILYFIRKAMIMKENIVI